MTEPILKLSNISKSFAGVQALEDISLEVRPGQVLCLLGDNGAGKSTLIKILAGFHKATTGQMQVNGEDVTFNSPKDASAQGIATVHQFGGTFPLMSVARSFFVGEERVYDNGAGKGTGFWTPGKAAEAKPPRRGESRAFT